MKVTLIYAAATGRDYGLKPALKVICETLAELGETIEDYNLYVENFPYFDGQSASSVKRLAASIKNADGVIFAFTSNLYAPAACMQNFFEYLTLPGFNNCLKDKNVFVIASSEAGGEAEALHYAGKVIRHFGGFDAARLGLNENLLKDLAANMQLRECIAKYAEDYYRVIRQHRKYILPLDYASAPVAYEATKDDYEKLIGYDKKETVSAEELSQKYDLNAFTEKQEEDIGEITRYFAGKYKENANITPNSHISARREPPPAPRTKTLKQMTQSLPHYYKPQLSEGLNAVIQIIVTGQDGFEGCLSVAGLECEYADGTAENPDITIICEADVWNSVLKGKYSAQKAFMVGYLKVRGNFVLLTKFDQAFKPQV